MVLHNGYGIRDLQEEEPIPFKDMCGSDVFLEDDVLVSPDGEILLLENAIPSFLTFYFRIRGKNDLVKKNWNIN